jgi:hypothetical protein
MGADLSDDGKSPPHRPSKLAGGERRTQVSHLHCHRLVERKINNGVTVYSRSRLIQLNMIPWTCLTDELDMLDGMILDNPS